MEFRVDPHQRILAYLREHAVPFEVLEHPPAGSAQDYSKTVGTRLEQQAKALFVRVDHAGGVPNASAAHAVVALQAQKRADLGVVGRMLGATAVKLADRVALREVTGCGFGELPPLGRIYGVPLVLDRDLLGEPRIYFNAGRLDRSVIIEPRHLEAVERPALF